MNRLSSEKRALILRCLVEGMSVRGAARTAGAAKGTVLKLLVDAGRACERCQDELFRDLRGRLEHRVQITTDGLGAYFDTIPYVFGEGADFAAVVKLYGDPDHAVHVTGRPDPDHINTCFVERHYATLRGSVKRYTRKTLAFSRKLESHAAQVALFMYAYNFVQPHRSLSRRDGPPTTPAMAAGIADWRTTMDDVVKLLDQSK